MKRNTLLIIVGFTIGAAFQLNHWFDEGPMLSEDQTRVPAAVETTREATRPEGKHMRLFDIEFSTPQGIPRTEEKDLVLKARVTLLQPVQGEVYFQWILPEDTQLVSGELTDSLTGLLPGQSFEKEVTVLGFAQQGGNKLITLQTWMNINGKKMGSAGVFSSHPNETYIGTGVTLDLKKKPLPQTLQQ